MSTESVEELTFVDELTEGSTVESRKLRFPWPIPVNIGVSGLYTSKAKIASLLPFPRPIRAIPAALPQSSNSRISDQLPTDDLEEDLTQFEVTSDFWWFDRDELRLDVDGRYPLLTASGSIKRFLRTRVHWIASIQRLGRNSWKGDIWYKDGDVAILPHTHVRITIAGSIFSTTRKAIVTFSGGGAQRRVRKLEFDSPYFHNVEFEFDHANNTNVVSSIETHDHPNRHQICQMKNSLLKRSIEEQDSRYDRCRSGKCLLRMLVETLAGATLRCMMPCKCIGQSSLTSPSGLCGYFLPLSMNEEIPWVVSCLMTSDQITDRELLYSITHSFPRLH